MRIAAYQAPLLPAGSRAAIALIGHQVKRCEDEGVSILCCPEAILGGLADNSASPLDFAIRVAGGGLAARLAPLASRTVTTIVGFTEVDGGSLYNSAVVWHDGAVAGVYRKWHPAIRKSVYLSGLEAPVFAAGGFTFGVILCNDSNFEQPARTLVAQGARALFVPTNNGMPADRGGANLVEAARDCDVAFARRQHVPVIRADVAGRHDGLISYGSSSIVNAHGEVIRSAPLLAEALLIGEI